MLARGPAKKVTLYLNEDTSHHLTSLYDAVMSLLLRKGVAGATATRGMSGFGQHQSLHSADNEFTAQHLPVVIEFIDSAEKVEELLPSLYDMVTDGVIEVQETTVIKSARKAGKPEPARPRQRQAGPARMLQIFLGEADTWHGEPLYDAIVKRLRMEDTAGATVEKGILGYGAKGHTHKEGFLHFSKDMPIVITVVDTPDKVTRAVQLVEGMMGDGLIVLSDVETVRLVHAPVPPQDSENPEVLVQELQPAKLLRIYVAERGRSAGRPIYEVIVEKCREMHIAGATVLRADEGFGSGPEIHRSRLLTHDRPIEISIVDEPARIDSLIPVLETLMITGTMVVSNVQIRRLRNEKEQGAQV